MPACRICQREFKSVQFQSARMAICGRCVNLINERAEPARSAYGWLGELLRRGMLRDIEHGLQSQVAWMRRRAGQRAANLEDEYRSALPA